MRRFIEKCWTHHLCRSGKPKVARYGTGLIWLALMPVGIYRSETGPGGSSVLFRYVRLIQRPRAAVSVALTGSPAKREFEAHRVLGAMLAAVPAVGRGGALLGPKWQRI